MSIHSWLLFILVACWLAISEEMHLKSIISLSWIKFLEYPFSQFKSSNQVQMCMNWKDIVISSIPFSIWYNHMWIMSISHLFLSALKFSLNSSYFSFLSVSGFANWNVWFWSPDMSGLHIGNTLGHGRPLSKNLKLDQNLFFGLTLLSILIYMIMWRLYGA
jgi:hypothetical protein